MDSPTLFESISHFLLTVIHHMWGWWLYKNQRSLNLNSSINIHTIILYFIDTVIPCEESLYILVSTNLVHKDINTHEVSTKQTTYMQD